GAESTREGEAVYGLIRVRAFPVDGHRGPIEREQGARVPNLIVDTERHQLLPHAQAAPILEVLLEEGHVELDVFLKLHCRTVTKSAVRQLNHEVAPGRRVVSGDHGRAAVIRRSVLRQADALIATRQAESLREIAVNR